jgi:hypothetical protein
VRPKPQLNTCWPRRAFRESLQPLSGTPSLSERFAAVYGTLAHRSHGCSRFSAARCRGSRGDVSCAWRGHCHCLCSRRHPGDRRLVARLRARGCHRTSNDLPGKKERIRPGSRGRARRRARCFRPRLSGAPAAPHGSPRPFRASVRTIDLLLVPVQPFAPLTLDAIRTLGSQRGLISQLQRYTAPFVLTGHPTVTLPGGFGEDDMAIGFQLAGHDDEGKLIQAATAFQRDTNWHRRDPISHGPHNRHARTHR